MTAWAEDILHYWLEMLGPKHWYAPTPEIDAEIRERFEPLWASLKKEKAIFFVGDAREALAAIILFDQFPRNIFRHEAAAFATDRLALGIARLALDAGFDSEFAAMPRQFFYMPFMHSEDIADQDVSVEMFDRMGNPDNLKYAIRHRDLIKRFGRFPHRNEILGRETLPEEVGAIAEGSNW